MRFSQPGTIVSGQKANSLARLVYSQLLDKFLDRDVLTRVERTKRLSVLGFKIERDDIFSLWHALCNDKILPAGPARLLVECCLALDTDFCEGPVANIPSVEEIALEDVGAENCANRLEEVFTDNVVMARYNV
jgi:hypothetical protein